jgi:hypothetical protein
MPFRVLDSLEWNNARATFGTDTFGLPLTRKFLLAVDSGNASLQMNADSSVMFPLKATVQSHATLLFGYVVDVTTGAVIPLDLTNAPVAGLDTWLRNGASSQPVTTGRRAVLALYDLTMNAPLDDFQPKPPAGPGPADTVRLYPLLSLWCATACDGAAADFAMTRPAASAMTDGMMPGAAIRGSFFTDANEEPRSVWQDMDPGLRDTLLMPTGLPFVDSARLAAVIESWKYLPSPRWDSIFAHYKLDSDLPVTAVVDRAKGRRTTSGVRRQKISATAAYAATDVTKVDGQGAFDNIHLAPEMSYKGAAASMAPICQEDCLHLHWRWSETFETFDNNYLFGWGRGAPYAKAGAPMIPENQNLSVSLTGTTFNYLPVATGVNPMSWQIFMHHGMAYVAKLTFVGDGLPALEAKGLTEVFPPPPWAQLYYHNRFWETGGTDRTADLPRLDEGANQSNFGPLESM